MANSIAELVNDCSKIITRLEDKIHKCNTGVPSSERRSCLEGVLRSEGTVFNGIASDADALLEKMEQEDPYTEKLTKCMSDTGSFFGKKSLEFSEEFLGVGEVVIEIEGLDDLLE